MCFGLCTDGCSPFGKSGRQYLQPRIEELKKLWGVGVPTYDVSKKHNFNMKVAFFQTISDVPAYGMLSGWSTAGRLSFPYCMENTKSLTLKYGYKQTWFDCHRQFLPSDHVFRQNKSAFYKDKIENCAPLERLSGKQIWDRISQFPKSGDIDPECRFEGSGVHHNWTKRSIFWELPYWSKLLIRHNLDVMHIEKNFFDNVFHTIMNVKGKSKYTVSARKDLKLFCKRRKLEAQDVVRNGSTKTIMPKASFVLMKDKRKVVCEWIQKLKFPDR